MRTSPSANRAIAAVAAAPSRADPAMSRRGSHTSDSVSSAETTAPVAKPSCTDVVSQAAPESSSPHASRNSGATALAENQRLIASRSTSASSAS